MSGKTKKSYKHGNEAGSVDVYKRLLEHAWPYRWVFIAGVVGMFIGAASEASFAALLKPIMDDGFVNRDQTIIRMTPFLLVGVFIIRGVGGFVDGYCIQWVGRKVIYDLRGLMFERMINLPTSYYDQHSTSELVAKLIFDVEQVAQASTTAVRIFFKDSFLSIALLTWLALLSWKLTLVFVAVAPVIALLVNKLSKRFRRTSTKIQESMGDITHVATEAFQGHQVVKVFNGYNREQRRFDKVNRGNRRFSMRKAVVASASVPIVMLVAGIAVAVIIFFAMGGAGGEIVSPGTFVSYLGALMLLQAPIKRLAKVNEIIQTGVAASNSIFGVLDLEPESRGGAVEAGQIQGKISFRDVHFSYPGRTDGEPVLNGLNLEINPGQTIALVGASGSGKSTVISLLLGFYRADQGVIEVDDIPIENYTRHSLRRTIALVTQNNFLFDGSIAENIGYGVDNIDLQALESSAETAQVTHFSSGFTGGLETRVGEQGGRLSGGQKQRVVIARALYKKAPVLVLDEATSALDNESEQLIRKAIDRRSGQQTIIVVAHRLSTVVNADCIHVVVNGRIVESGSHRELIALDGTYSKLLSHQSN